MGYNNDERCFLCDPCRDVISRTILETVNQPNVSAAEVREQLGNPEEREC
jgi:hypothetical protein